MAQIIETSLVIGDEDRRALKYLCRRLKCQPETLAQILFERALENARDILGMEEKQAEDEEDEVLPVLSKTEHGQDELPRLSRQEALDEEEEESEGLPGGASVNAKRAVSDYTEGQVEEQGIPDWPMIVEPSPPLLPPSPPPRPNRYRINPIVPRDRSIDFYVWQKAKEYYYPPPPVVIPPREGHPGWAMEVIKLLRAQTEAKKLAESKAVAAHEFATSIEEGRRVESGERPWQSSRPCLVDVRRWLGTDKIRHPPGPHFIVLDDGRRAWGFTAAELDLTEKCCGGKYAIRRIFDI